METGEDQRAIVLDVATEAGDGEHRVVDRGVER
jgi:hypothetical protein